MDDLELSAELTAINFMLEMILASGAMNAGQSADDIDDLAEEAQRQLGLNATSYGNATADQEEVRELASHRVAMMLSRVRDRLKQAGR